MMSALAKLVSYGCTVTVEPVVQNGRYALARVTVEDPHVDTTTRGTVALDSVEAFLQECLDER